MASYGKSVDHSLEAEIDLSGADDFGDILYDMSTKSMHDATFLEHTLGSLGSRRATLMPSSLKYPLA